ncbi:OmpA family protein [Xylophilus sp. ASV27]|uniref:OmpA family protein n=1 Tax=Xylophilus sp. ASV27 TaxID=2795129 RepID=UPI0018ED6F5B|nr:OmpA family protein [Xylophilus sp. ASV27]
MTGTSLSPTRRAALMLASLTLTACTTVGTPSKNTTDYYYASQRAQGGSPVSAVVTRPAPAALAQDGPAGVSKIVYFDFDKAVVKPEYREIIRAHSDFLRAEPRRSVVLEGSTDERGGREYNLALGQRRADAVRQSMVLLGVPDSQIEAVSLGMEKPASPLRTEEGYRLNRRVEFRYP